MVNPAFWQTLNPETRYGLIKHEVLHIVFKHLMVIHQYSNKRLFNIAADIVVNQYIDPQQLPNGGITIDKFLPITKKFNIAFAPNMDVGYYYKQLSELINKVTKNQPAPQENTEQAIAILNGEHPDLKKHELWKKFQDLSASEMQILEQLVNTSLKRVVDQMKAKNQFYGKLPAGLQQKLEALMQALAPKFNWKRILRLFSATSTSSYIKNTLRRPSKRYGTTPGIKVKRRNRLLVAIDTSGSVHIKELQEFFSEIYHIWRKGAEIFIVECDTAIHKKYRYTGITPKTISGRGGTDFSAPIQFANEEYHPDAIIYFTDGYAAVPIAPRCPMLWIITSNGLKEGEQVWNELPGQKLKIPT